MSAVKHGARRGAVPPAALLRRIDRFLQRTGMCSSRFGRDATGDPRLVADLQRGRWPGPILRQQVSRFIKSHRAKPAPNQQPP